MRQHSHMRWTGLGLVLALAVAGPAAVWAQAAGSPIPPALKGMDLTELAASLHVPEVAPVNATVPRTYGTTSEVAHIIPATQFEPESNLVAFGFVLAPAPTAGVIRFAGGAGALWAGVRLPAGALITRLELEGVDSTPGGEIFTLLIRATSPPGPTPIKILAGMATGAAATPGSALFPYSIFGGLTPADLTVDNAGHSYFIGLGMNGPGLGFSSVRVFYQLQVSPAPVAGTFGDVPTSHPFFQYIEAFVASGLSAGCGGGNYCPDAPLTRGQMAVFLGRALGLHFAP